MLKSPMKIKSQDNLVENHLIGFLKTLTYRLCKHFHLPACPEVVRMDVDDELYGHAWGYYVEGQIIVQCRRRNGRFLPIEELVDTLIHELAHMYDEDTLNRHRVKWFKNYEDYKKWCKENLHLKLR